jgi:tetratricopeptide (TPR) repeat protein
MKKNIAYISLAGFFILFIALIIIFGREEKIPELKERSKEISNSTEWLNTKAAIEEMRAKLRANPDDKKTKLNLALAYIQESRITGNHSYYDKASLQLIDEILKKDENNFDAVCAKATVLLSQHHFAEALVEGKRAVLLNPYSAFGYGILTDANVELGNYGEAILAADNMNSIRPDLRSYSRISYLREIFGDNVGARDAMKHAVESGIPGLEQTEWCRVYYGKLFEETGDLAHAQEQYLTSLNVRPDYAYALAGLGRIEKAKGNFHQAIDWFKKAKIVLADYSFSEELAGLYDKTNEKRLAEQELSEALELLGANSKSESQNIHGHYADRELALLYLKKGDSELALKHALLEYNRRPANIDVNQALAWVYYQRKEMKEANKCIDASLKTNSKNPVLLYRAGLIKAGNGNLNAGIALMNEALNINPFLDSQLKREGRQYLASR